MTDRFDWKEVEPGDLVVSEARDTVAYLNTQNDIVIRQRADWPHEEEDPFLVIPRHRVRALIERLNVLLDSANKAGDH